MSNIKAYPDINQCKKLAEILPLESADMGWYYSCNPQAARNQMWVGTKSENADIPCWSLAALLDVIPQVKLDNIKQYDKKYWRCCAYFASDWHNSNWCDNPVDACYEMILKLHELKML